MDTITYPTSENHTTNHSLRILGLAAVCLLLVVLPARADLYTWSAVIPANWGTGSSWDLLLVPTAADDALFSASGARTVNVDGARSITNVSFTGSGAWTVAGTGTTPSLTLTGTLAYGSSGVSTIGVRLSGTGGLTATAGQVDITNNTNNYSGATLIDGAKVRIGGAAPGTPFGTGLLRLKSGNLSGIGTQNYSAITNPYRIEGDFSFGGTTDTITNQFSGTGTLYTANANLTVPVGAGVALNGIIGENAAGYGFTKLGAGTMTLAGLNTFTGQVVIKEGTIGFTGGSATIGSANPLGKYSTILLGDSTLGADAAIIKGNGAGTLWQDITVVGGAGLRTIGTGNQSGGTYSGTITLNKDVVFTTVGGDNATFSGRITGTGNITKTGTATATFSGATANDYVGSMFVTDGILSLGKTAGLNAITGNVKVGDYIGAAVNRDILKLAASNQIADSVAILIASTGQFDLNNFSETVATVTGTGNINTGTTGTPTLTFGGDNAAVTLPGVLTGTVGSISYVGTGGLTLTGVSPAYTGSIAVTQSTLI
ncbi:MAG: autotransporter-associated beta strand repeat-containing protein, partial [Phycisphaerae bacterium]|nr:autotransporter-associated beta strand repeat-containing protein [Phycisphaerae bacterium]